MKNVLCLFRIPANNHYKEASWFLLQNARFITICVGIYCHKLFDHAKQSATDSVLFGNKKLINGNKYADKDIKDVSQSAPEFASETDKNQ